MLQRSNFTGGNPGNVSLSTAGGIHFELVNNVIIKNSNFNNLIGIDGGAMNMLSSESFKELLEGDDQSSFNLENVKISNCYSSTNGGGIHIYNTKRVVIKNSQISNNNAYGEGGGIYFYCYPV